jgi:branched-chain amino acid transport system substrate-binding protein
MILAIETSGQVAATKINDSDMGERNLTIGVLLPLTGDLKANGEVANASIEVARRDFQRMYPGATVNFLIEDTSSDPAIALERLKSLHKEGIKIAIGPMSSAEAGAMKAYAESNDILLISSTSTAPSLAYDDTLFRLEMNDSRQAEALASFAIKEGIELVIPLYRADIYGEDFIRIFGEQFVKAGGAVVRRGVKYSPSIIDLNALVTSLETELNDSLVTYSANKVAVLLVSFDEAADILDRVSDRGLPHIRWLGTDSSALNKAITDSKKAADFAVESNFTASVEDFGVVFHPFVPSNAVSEYTKQKVIEQLGRLPDPSYQYNYDMLWLAALTLLKADSGDLRDTMQEVASQTYGFSGPLAFDKYGDREYGHYGFYKLLADKESSYRWDLIASYHLRKYQVSDRLLEREFDSGINGSEITIGALLPLSGSLRSEGLSNKLLLDKAESDINMFLNMSLGGSSRINIVCEDTESDPQIALDKLKYLHGKGIDYFIGPYSSAEMEALKSYSDSSGVIFLSPSSTAPSSLAENDSIFRLTLNDNLQAEAIAKMLVSEGIDNVIPLYRDDIYGRELLAAFNRSFNGTLDSGIGYNPDTKDFSIVVNELDERVKSNLYQAEANRTAVLLISLDEAADILKNAEKRSPLSSVRWFGADGVAKNPLIEKDPQAASFALNVSLTASIISLDVAEVNLIYLDVFVNDLEDIIKSKPTPYNVATYDAPWMYVYALIDQNWNTSNSNMKKALIKISQTFGFSGQIAFNDVGDRSYGDFGFYRFEKGDANYQWKPIAVYRYFWGKMPELIKL